MLETLRVAAVAALHASARWDGLRVGADGGGATTAVYRFRGPHTNNEGETYLYHVTQSTSH